MTITKSFNAKLKTQEDDPVTATSQPVHNNDDFNAVPGQ